MLPNRIAHMALHKKKQLAHFGIDDIIVDFNCGHGLEIMVKPVSVAHQTPSLVPFFLPFACPFNNFFELVLPLTP